MSTVRCVNLLAPPTRLLVGRILLTSLFRATLLGLVGLPLSSSSKRAEDGDGQTRINQALAHSPPPARRC
jgi:hypothetical protein